MKKNGQVKIVDVFIVCEWFFKLGGGWPLKKGYIKYGFLFLYYVITTIMSYIDLFNVFGNLHLMVENLLETLVVTMALLMTVVVRFHPSLVDMIVTIRNEIALNDYHSNEERYLYYAYNRIAYSLSKIAIASSTVTVLGMYLKPLTNTLPAIIKALGGNDTSLDDVALILPFKASSSFHITDIRIYIIFYVYRLPYVYLGVCHTATVCLILSLVLHVCGKLSVLKSRIEMLETTSKKGFEAAIRLHVQDHLQLINMVKTIENIFQYILLLDLAQTSVRLGLSAYVALTSKDAGSELMLMFTFASYACVLFIILYSYCFVGEYLTQESKNLTDAYYYCDWQKMPVSCKNSLMICMICAQTPLSFTAGKCYKFSLYGFTGIVKTSMAYLSMLRTVV